jgi:hypothetical protein
VRVSADLENYRYPCFGYLDVLMMWIWLVFALVRDYYRIGTGAQSSWGRKAVFSYDELNLCWELLKSWKA